MAVSKFGPIVRDCKESIECYLRRGRARGSAALPVAELTIERTCDNAGCLANEADLNSYLAKFNRADTWTGAASQWRPTISAIDLEEFKTFADFSAAVSRQSRGNDNRAVQKAGRKGYRARNLGVEIDRYAGSIAAIDRSTLFRSGGLVWDALLPRQNPPADRVAAPVVPYCPRHWAILWGVFAPAEAGAGEKLVAYASIARTGNFVRTLHVMGHQDFLHDGVMKLLFFDIAQWLLGRDDPVVQGVRYFVYGAIEHGRDGLYEWKRRLQFKPFLLAGADAAARPSTTAKRHG